MALGGVGLYQRLQRDTGNARAAISRVEAEAREVGCGPSLVRDPGFVFMTCDITSLPNLTEAPALDSVRSLLAPRAKEGLLGLSLTVDVFRPASVQSGKSQRCDVNWFAFDSDDCDAGEPNAPDDVEAIQRQIKTPSNFISSFIMASSPSITLGKFDTEAIYSSTLAISRFDVGVAYGSAGYHLVPSLRDQLVRRVWNDYKYSTEVPLLGVDALTPYKRSGSLKEEQLCSDASSGLISTCCNLEPAIGDVQGRFKAVRVDGVSIFAQQTVYGDVHPGISLDYGVGPSEDSLPSLLSSALGSAGLTWPQHSPKKLGDALLAPIDGIGFILPSKMPKNEAISKLRQELSEEYTCSLIGGFLLGVFSSFWNSVGFFMSFGLWSNEGSRACCFAGGICTLSWGIIFLTSLAMMLLNILALMFQPAAFGFFCILFGCCCCCWCRTPVTTCITSVCAGTFQAMQSGMGLTVQTVQSGMTGLQDCSAE